MKKFDIPPHYRSSIISKIKNARKAADPRKKDFSPTKLNFGSLELLIPRHFGFCYGVENAIEIAYKTIAENPEKRIFLLSEMIHNPGVNADLQTRGVKFLMDTAGNSIFPWEALTSEDIVVIPAFGTTVEIEQKLNGIGINPYKYNTTCPFVEKVWNRSNQLGADNYTVIIHGKHTHEETRATFSHSVQNAGSVIVLNLRETKFLSDYIMGGKSSDEFYKFFEGKLSPNFNPETDLLKIGVVNQTTMLASETEAISDLLKETMIKKYGSENLKDHFADTRDTLCYATNDNQDATYGVLKEPADIALIIGGYNSSNTSHIVELCEEKLPSYFISSSQKLVSREKILHFDLHRKMEIETENYLPVKHPLRIIVTSGASCPDAVVDEIIIKLLRFFNFSGNIDEVIEQSLHH